jgi:hypothetical protein
MVTLNFKWVQFHSAYGLLAIVSTFHGYTYYRTKDRGSLTMLVAVSITCVASLIYVNQISFHTWYNYLDLSHTLMAIAAYVFYLAAVRLEKRTGKQRAKTKNPVAKNRLPTPKHV